MLARNLAHGKQISVTYCGKCLVKFDETEVSFMLLTETEDGAGLFSVRCKGVGEKLKFVSAYKLYLQRTCALADSLGPVYSTAQALLTSTAPRTNSSTTNRSSAVSRP